MKVQITNGMLMAIIINMVYSKAIGLTQGSIAREVGSDMWLSTLIAILIAFPMMIIVIKVIRRLPDADIIQQCEIIAGRWVGGGLSLVCFVFFLFSYGSIMATFVFHLKDYFLPEVPILLIVLIILFLSSYAAYYGLEVIARMSLIGLFALLSLNISLLIGSLSHIEIRELLPIFESGVLPTSWASRHHTADWAVAIMVVAFILPNVKNKEAWKGTGIASVILGGFYILMWPILEVAVLSSEVAGQYILSCMQLARSAEIGHFIHRYEMIMVAFFSLSALTQMMMLLLCSSLSIQRLFALKDYRRIIFPVSLVLSGYSYWMVFDHQRAMEIIETYWVAISLGIMTFIIFFVSLFGLIFKKKLISSVKK